MIMTAGSMMERTLKHDKRSCALAAITDKVGIRRREYWDSVRSRGRSGLRIAIALRVRYDVMRA